ncbi:hypothetical protein WJX79_005886 [Trebouxia sp. C0005]
MPQELAAVIMQRAPLGRRQHQEADVGSLNRQIQLIRLPWRRQPTVQLARQQLPGLSLLTMLVSFNYSPQRRAVKHLHVPTANITGGIIMFDRTPVRGGTIRAHHGQKPAGHTPQTPKAPDPEELMSLVPDSRFKNQGVFGKFDSPVKAGQPANFPAPPEARRPVEYSSRQFCKPFAEEIPFHKLVKTLSQKGFFAMDDGKMLFKKASHIDNQSTNSQLQECSHVLLHDEAKPTLLTQTPVEEAGPSSRHMYGQREPRL